MFPGSVPAFEKGLSSIFSLGLREHFRDHGRLQHSVDMHFSDRVDIRFCLISSMQDACSLLCSQCDHCLFSGIMFSFPRCNRMCMLNGENMVNCFVLSSIGKRASGLRCRNVMKT